MRDERKNVYFVFGVVLFILTLLQNHVEGLITREYKRTPKTECRKNQTKTLTVKINFQKMFSLYHNMKNLFWVAHSKSDPFNNWTFTGDPQSSKLRRWGPKNRIVDDSDSTPFKFECGFWFDLKADDDIISYWIVSISFQLKLIHFQLKLT